MNSKKSLWLLNLLLSPTLAQYVNFVSCLNHTFIYQPEFGCPYLIHSMC